jgi:hypothetical protein
MTRSGENFAETITCLRQDPQEVARKAADAGERVVGYVGNDIPVALILAAGALPVRLRAKADAGTARIDHFVETSFAAELRVIANQWLEGSLDHLDAVIFARGDDSGQRLYYYLCELRRRGLCGGPTPLLYDVASLAREASFEHTLESTRLLAAEVHASTHLLEQALQRLKRRADLLRAVQARRALPAPLPGSAAWALEYAAACDWRDEFDDCARRWLSEATLLHIPRRVVLAGDPLPDNQMHLAIEVCGASVVLELTESTLAGEQTQRDPLCAIADEFQRRESPAVSMRRNGRWLAECALDQRADAVIVWLSEQNEALPWEIARQMRALRDAGIPALLLDRQPWQLSALVLAQVMDFVRNPGKSR